MPNASGWYRCYLPTNQLIKNGYKVGMGNPSFSYSSGYTMITSDKKIIDKLDIVVLKLISLKQFIDYTKRALEIGQKIVVDIDDYKEDDISQDKIIEVSSAIITSTPFLKSFYEKKYPNIPVFLIRNGIDLDVFNVNKVNYDTAPTFGWVGATPWRIKDLEELNPFFGEFIKNNNYRFHHSGNIDNAPSAAELIGLSNGIVTSQPKVSISLYPKLFKNIDIGLVPLAKNLINNGKSFIRGLEFSASGIPFIASPSPEYKYLAECGVGRIANNPEEWISHAKELVDPEVRKNEADKNILMIKEKFSMGAVVKDWEYCFNEISKV
jgi:glycosyltransferase involved in cell wall biosynthesis